MQFCVFGVRRAGADASGDPAFIPPEAAIVWSCAVASTEPKSFKRLSTAHDSSLTHAPRRCSTRKTRSPRERGRGRVYRAEVLFDGPRLNSTVRGPPLISDGLQLSVLGTFRFWVADKAVPALSGGSQRLLAFLALRDRAVTRVAAAGTLWPDATQTHAFSSLRSALSRLDEVAQDAVVATRLELSFADGIPIDFREAQAIAHRLVDVHAPRYDFDLSPGAVTALSTDLLPDWFDDWVVIENEDWRQLRLHALEALATRLTEGRRFGEAIHAALAAIGTEPLRESSRAALIRVHLAEGNQSEALRVYENYRTLLSGQLGIEPTGELHDLACASLSG
jgi:DNA-binding SARP family transcriptional activator